MRFLSEYPRPATDNGWGFHDSAGANVRPGDAAAYARYLRQDLGVTWFKALVAGTGKVDLVRAFTQAGIEVIVRLYAYQPHPHYVVPRGEVRAYVEAGVHYFEWGNEPNLVLEWERPSWNEGARVDKVCEQFLRNADVIRAAGGIPLLPALAPGGDYPHRDWYRTMFEWFRLHGHLSDLEGAALAIHNRPLNCPLNHRSPTGCSFLDYEWIDDLVRAYVGRSLPLLGTEAGYEPGWHQNPTFPPIDLQRHAAYNLEIFRSFGPYGSTRWRDALFCQCMWLVESFGHKDFSEAAWHRNSQWAQGGDLPAVGALRSEWQRRPFKRQWSWEIGRPDYPKATWRGSPNTDARPAGVRPAMVVLYATGGDFNQALRRLQDPATKTSYHYLVSRSGAIYQLVPEANRAWHAGNASWGGRPRVNDYSIAIGLVNRNDGSDRYPAEQTEQAATLVRHLMTKYKISLQDVVTADMIGGTRLAGFDLPAFQILLGGVPQIWPPEDVVRKAAWDAGGIAYNPDAAFPRFARQRGLGNPETPEFDFELDGRLYRGQGFSEGIVYAEVGRWDQIDVRPW